MTAPDRLAALARLQSLRERRERVRTEGARLALTASERDHRKCRSDEEAMQNTLVAESRQANLCPDRWRMLAGQLNLQADRTCAASARLVTARHDFGEASDQLKREVMRAQEVEARFRKAARKFAAKKNESQLEIIRSLNASVNGGASK